MIVRRRICEYSYSTYLKDGPLYAVVLVQYASLGMAGVFPQVLMIGSSGILRRCFFEGDGLLESDVERARFLPRFGLGSSVLLVLFALDGLIICQKRANEEKYHSRRRVQAKTPGSYLQ